MQDLGNTQFFQVEVEPETGVKIILSAVFEALTEKIVYFLNPAYSSSFLPLL